jgi:hypothetical protein
MIYKSRVPSVPSFPTTGRSSAFFFTLLLAGALLLGPGGGVQRCAAGTGFPTSAGDESTFSIGVFQLNVDPAFAYLFAPAPTYSIYYAGFSASSGILTGPFMFDGNTVIGVSAKHVRPATSFPIAAGTAAGYSPASPTYANINGYGDYALIPPPFASAPSGVDEIFTEIEQLNLTGYFVNTNVSAGCSDPRVPTITSATMGQLVSVVAGPIEIPGLPDNLRCIGMVQQITNGATDDFSAQSFFDIFVQVTLPGMPGTASYTDFPLVGGVPEAVLYNDASDPLLIENLDVSNLPPTVTYVHGHTTAEPVKFLTSNPPYWSADEVLGYLTLAGHGVFTNVTTSKAPCAAAIAPGGLLDLTLGPMGSPLPSPPVPWLRPANTFPSSNSSYSSVVNTTVDSTTGATNVLDDTVSFSPVAGNSYTLSDLSLGSLSNAIAPPSLGNNTSYAADSVPLTFQASSSAFSDSKLHSGSASSSVTMVITNNGASGSTTLYATALQQGYWVLTVRKSGVEGLLLQLNPTNASLGQHTIAPDPRGYRVSSYFDVFLQLSDDGGNTWANANRSIRLYASMPPAAPSSLYFNQVGNNVVLQWQNAFPLQSATNLQGPFIDLPGPVTTGPYTNAFTSSQQYFRLRQY